MEGKPGKRKTKRPRKYNSSEFFLGKQAPKKTKPDPGQQQFEENKCYESEVDDKEIRHEHEEQLSEDESVSSIEDPLSPIFTKKFKTSHISSSSASTSASSEGFKTDVESLEISDCDILSEEEVESEEEYTAVTPKSFTFTLTAGEWSRIKPESSLVGRHLGKSWTNMFSRKIEDTIPSCVLRFTYNRVAKKDTRKKNAVFFSGKAKCTFDNCVSFDLSIPKEPLDTDESTVVDVNINGNISHPRNECRKRHLSGDRREEYREEACKSGSSNLHYRKLGETSEAAFAAGNRTQASSKAVLRNLIHESNLAQKLDADDWRDLVITQEVMKDNHESPHLPGYIQLLSYSPFVSVCFKEDQLKIFREKVKSGDGVLYLDATGTVVKRTNNKEKSVFYYAAVVKGTKPKDPPLPIWEMLSNDQSATAIMLGLSKFKQESMKLFQRWRLCQPRRVEVDFSWPLINSVLLIFNQENISAYLKRAWNMATNTDSKESFSLLHICAAHLLKRFRDKVGKITSDKGLAEFYTYVFTLFQNATSVETASLIYEEMCLLALNEKEGEEVIQARENLKHRVKNMSYLEEIEELETELKDVEESEMGQVVRTIKASSPFHSHFSNIRVKTKISNIDMNTRNAYCCPQVLDMMESYLYLFPLWSGMLLIKESSSQVRTRDTNCHVENWFNIVKNTILKKKLRRPAGVFIRQIHSEIKGRIRECLTSMNDEKIEKKKKNKKGQSSKLEQDDIDNMEEKWQRRKPRDTSSKYFSPPPKVPGPRVKKLNLGKPASKQDEKKTVDESSGSDDLPDLFTDKGQQEKNLSGSKPKMYRMSSDDNLGSFNVSDTSISCAQHGLANKNNNCWLNSMLQAMKHVKRFIEPKTSSGKRGKDDVVDVFLNKLQKLMKPSERFTVHSVNEILEVLKIIPEYSEISHGGQCDPTDLIQDLMLRMHEMGLLVPSLIQNDRRCWICNEERSSVEPVFVLFAEIPSFAPSIQNCVDEFLKEEVLAGQDSVMCNNCQKKRTHTKSTTFDTVSETLVLVIKRFHSRNRKNSTPVAISQNLTIPCTSGVKHMVLRSVQLHHGNAIQNGHYTTLGITDKNVINYNDNYIKIDPKDVLESRTTQRDVYILYYEQCDASSIPEENVDFNKHFGDDENVLKRVGGYEIRKEDLASLDGNNWLTDQIINATFHNMCTPRVTFKDTFFLETIQRKGLESVKKIEDINSYDYIFFPCHTPGHWSLVVFDVRRTFVSLLDPLKNLDTTFLSTIGKYLKRHGLKVLRNKTLEKEAPAQISSGDCGVFVIAYARVLIDGRSLKEMKVDSAELRRKIKQDLGL